ncbi:Transcriptional regulator, TetR family protein [Minicystis rosea]|nr:Transcriptional regulator, TetR family protein [Minicystis rosea]
MTQAPRRRRAPEPPPRPYHHGDLRRAVLDDALVLIEERGHLDFTLREVARRLGVSHAAPYRHFPDKRALLTALATEATSQLGARIGAALTATRGDLRAQFLAAGHAYVRYAVDAPAAFQTMFSRDIDEQDPSLVLAKESCFGLLLRYIDDAQRAAVLPRDDPMTLARAIWAMHHGLAALAAAGAFPVEDAEALRAIVDDAHGRLYDGLVRKRR